MSAGTMTSVRAALRHRMVPAVVVSLAAGLVLLVHGQQAAFAASQGPASISAGFGGSCAVESGMAFCWGNNSNGQLGDGSTTDSSAPVAVDTTGALAGKTLTQITGSAEAACALDSGGAAYCWGGNFHGDLGDGSMSDSSVPMAVDTGGVLAGKTLTQITAGAFETCALDSAGAAYCWGGNGSGELGDGSLTDSSVPVAVDTSGVLAGKTLTQITTDFGTTCALDSAGAAYCWGANGDGDLGDGSLTDSSVPVAVDTSGVLAGKTLTQISVGVVSTCALDSAGAAYCWGDDSNGQLGDGSAADSSVPVAVDTGGVLAGKTLTQIAAGWGFTCALDSESAAYCWGNNANGQLGDGTVTDSSVPVAVDTSGVLADKALTQIAAGQAATCALDSGGAAYCWGWNGEGGLGDDSAAAQSTVPVLAGPQAPASVTATPGDTTATVSWTAPASLDGGTLTRYTATASPGGAGCRTTGATTCIITGLTDGVTYSITVVAHTTAGDSGASAPGSVTPTGGSQPKPPVLADIESAALRYAAGAAPVRVTQSLTVTSPTATLAGATVRVSSGFAAGQDALAFTGRSGITGSYSAGTGVLTLTGTATVSAYVTELRSVTYRDTDAAAPYGTRAISFQVSDGEPGNSLSNVESRTVLVTAKPPVASGDKATTGKNAPVTINVLANDTDPAGLPLTIASVNTTGTKGTVTVNHGQTTITYNPDGQFASLAAGQTTTDTFTYKATDGHQTSNSATVTVTITGSGTAPQPPTVTAHHYNAVGNTPLGVGTTPAAPAATVTGTVLSGDTDPDPTATLSVTASIAPAHGTVAMKPNGAFTYLPNLGYSGTDTFQCTIAGSNDPTLTETETVTITVGTRVWYVNNSDSAAGNGEAASPFNTLAAAGAAAGPDSILFLYQGKGAYTGGVIMQPGEDLWGQPHGLTVGGYSLVPAGGSTPAITNERGDGIDLAEGADVEGVNVSSPSGDGIAAVSVNDATVGATTPVAVSGAGGDGVSINGGAGTLNFGDTSVTGSAGDSVSVASRSAGSVTFGGPISGTGGGVSLTSNGGATIAFTGTLTLSTDNAAFTATGGGTVTATGTGSTLTSLIQTVLTVQNTTIGAAGLRFQSVSSNGSYSNGLDLANTGASGGLTVTGTGASGSGGTLQNALEAGIYLTSTRAPSFTDMVIENNAAEGISGSRVNGLTLADSTVSGNGEGPYNPANEGHVGLDFSPNGTGSPDGLTGTVLITNSVITDNSAIGDTSGTLALTVTGTTIGDSINGSTANDGLLIDADGTTNATVSVTGSTFNSFFEFATATGSTGTNRVTFSGNTSDASVVISPHGNSHTAITIDGNNMQYGQGIEIDEDGTSGTLTGTVHGNIIGTPGGDPGAVGGIGISAEGSVTETLAITGNDLYQYSIAGGIHFLDQEGNPAMNLTITGNLITDPRPDPAGYGTWGILGQDGALTSDNGTVCAVITGNSVVGSGETGYKGQAGADLELEQNDATAFQLPGYSGGKSNIGAIESFLEGNNNDNGTPTALAAVSGSGGGFVGASGC